MIYIFVNVIIDLELERNFDKEKDKKEAEENFNDKSLDQHEPKKEEDAHVGHTTELPPAPVHVTVSPPKAKDKNSHKY